MKIFDKNKCRNAELIGDKTNCPNCGAPINSEICPYCGTIFIDFSCVDTRKPFYLMFNFGGKVVKTKVMLMGADMSTPDPPITPFGAVEICCAYQQQPELTIRLLVLDEK